MRNFSEYIRDSPRNIAVAYGIFGFLWIFITDQIVFTFVTNSGRITQLQTIKGWIFVALSTVLVYALVWYGQQNLRTTNERLDTAFQQLSILHRILRHNLRNSCNIIQGNAQLLQERLSGDSKAIIDTVDAQNDRLIKLSNQSRTLREITLSSPLPTTEFDLSELIAEEVATIANRYPHATIEVDTPSSLVINTNTKLRDVIAELLDNAIKHHDKEHPTLHISAELSVNGTVVVDIADDGPGIPTMERDVLEWGFEEPKFHSLGLGLWIARTFIERTDGEFRVIDNEPRGTIIQLRIPNVAPR